MADEERFEAADLRRLATGHLAHESETAWYVLVSMSDYVLSYLLFTQGTLDGRSAFEANPLAAWFLNHYGLMKGLLVYKVLAVIAVCVIVQLISLKQQRLGRLLLWLAIAATGYVVIYSLKLMFGVR